MTEKTYDRKCPICGGDMQMGCTPPSPSGTIYALYGCLKGCGAAWTAEIGPAFDDPISRAEKIMPLDRFDEAVENDESMQLFIEARKKDKDLTVRDFLQDKPQYDETFPYSWKRMGGSQ